MECLPFCIRPSKFFVCVILQACYTFLVDQTRYLFGSVSFLVYIPTVFVFPHFAFPFSSRVVAFFFDVGVMGVTLRSLASRDNLIKKCFYMATS